MGKSSFELASRFAQDSSHYDAAGFVGRLLKNDHHYLDDYLAGAPRLFVKKLVGDVLDRIELNADFDPRQRYRLTVIDHELTPAERQARHAESAEDIALDLGPSSS